MKQKEKTMSLPNPAARSAQGAIPFTECYENNLFMTSPGNYTIVCDFRAVGYLSRTESEQERKYKIYRKMLCALPPDVHYEEVIYNRPVNADTYINALAGKKDFENKYEKAFFEMQRGFAEKTGETMSVKRYLAAFSFCSNSGTDAYSRLIDAYRTAASFFEEMGSKLRILSIHEVFTELYRAYNPFGESAPAFPADLFKSGLLPKDLIAPPKISFSRDYIDLGTSYMRVLAVVDYGAEITDVLTHSLLRENSTIRLTKHIEHVAKEVAIKEIKQKLDQLEQRAQTKKEKNKAKGTDYIPNGLLEAIKGCNDLLTELEGNEEFMRQTLYLTACAETLPELDELTARLSSTALSVHCTLRASGRMFAENVFDSTLPLGRDYMTLHKFMLASEAAVATPFSYESNFDSNGFFYGYNEHSGEPVIINRRADKSSNGFVFGKTGAGKGMWVKSEIANILFQPYTADCDVIVIDADGEYLRVARAFGGKITTFSPAPEEALRLNPMAISCEAIRVLGEEPAKASKISFISALLSQLKSGGGNESSQNLTGTELSIIDEAVSKCLKKKNPTLKMLYTELAADERAAAKSICGWLARYVSGSVTLFAGERQRDISGDRFRVYCVKDLPGDIRAAGMIYLLEEIEDRVMQNYIRGRWTYVYVEEMHRYFDKERNPFAAERFGRMFSELRKFGCVLTGITQLPIPVLNAPDGAVMLHNSSFVAITELDKMNATAISDLYDLNDEQRRTLFAPEVGQYIIRTKGTAISVKYLIPGAKKKDKNDIYDLFDTSFGKRNEKNAAEIN